MHASYRFHTDHSVFCKNSNYNVIFGLANVCFSVLVHVGSCPFDITTAQANSIKMNVIARQYK